MSKITKNQKIQIYEQFLHILQLYSEVCMDNEKVRKLIFNACNWSYAHRIGNGELSDKQQQNLIDEKFYKLLEL